MDAFWKNRPLSQLSKQEWEALCDGCGKCCMIRLEDEDTQEVHITNVACKLFGRTSCQCSNYSKRSRLVPDCVTLTPQNVDELYWMPDTCAYKLLAGGKELPQWHYLVCGDRNAIHEQGQSVRDRSICETMVEAEDLEDHLVNWPGERRRG